MSEYTYEHTDSDGDQIRAGLCDPPSDLGWIQVDRSDGKITTVYVPAGHAPSIVEALTGRKVAAVIYEDELPRVRVSDESLRASGVTGYWLPESDPNEVRRVARKELLGAEAIARHIEARDAAAKEQERAEEERVEAKAQELATLWHESDRAGGYAPAWGHVFEGYKDAWRAVARHVLAGEQAGR